MNDYITPKGRLLFGDCLARLDDIPDGKVDMVFCDLPYGVTSAEWDVRINLEQLWQQLTRVCKPGAAVVFTATQPFTSLLVTAKLDWFKCEWIWWKSLPTGFMIAGKRPMQVHESCLLFSIGRKAHTYNPQKEARLKPRTYRRPSGDVAKVYGVLTRETGESRTLVDKHPQSIIPFGSVPQSSKYPTQKPVMLIQYLIKTYSNEGEVVLDPTCGSGTTAIACINTKRKFVIIDNNPEAFEISRKRIHTELNTGFQLD